MERTYPIFLCFQSYFLLVASSRRAANSFIIVVLLLALSQVTWPIFMRMVGHCRFKGKHDGEQEGKGEYITTHLVFNTYSFDDFE